MDPQLPSDCEYHLTQLFQTPELRREIRAYLRYRLFTSLQNSTLGPCLARKDVQPISPKLQTLNLLLAEYLLRYRHHFSLSVFSCEVPSVSCLSPSLQDTMMGRTSSASVPFKNEDLQDMLETLGLSPSSAASQELTHRYREQDEPLLVCLIRALPKLSSPAISASVQRSDRACNTEQQQADPLQASVTTAHHTAIALLRRQHAEELERVQGEWLAQLGAQEQLLHQMSSKQAEEQEHRSKRAKEEEEQRSSKHAQEEQRLRDLILSLQEQLALAEQTLAAIRAEKIAETERVEEEQRRQESALATQEQMLHARQLSLGEEALRLEREKAGLKRVKKKLQTRQQHLDEVALALVHSQPDATAEAARYKSLLPALEIQLQLKDQEISELKAVASSLKGENQTLGALTEQQRLRINNLNVRMAELVSELHCSTRENVAEISLPQWAPQRSRHRSSSSSGSSPTDDIVRDAKRRIKTLEEEFEAIGRYHKDFQVRRFNESLVSSVLGTSSGQIFASQQSQASLQPGVDFNSTHLQLNAAQQSHRYQTQPPPIPKLPKPRSPRQRNIATEFAKLVIQSPRQKNGNVENLESASSSNEYKSRTEPLSEPRRNFAVSTPQENVDVSKQLEVEVNEYKSRSELSSSPRRNFASSTMPHETVNVTNQLEQSVKFSHPTEQINNMNIKPSNDAFHKQQVGPMGDAHMQNPSNFPSNEQLVHAVHDSPTNSHNGTFPLKVNIEPTSVASRENGDAQSSPHQPVDSSRPASQPPSHNLVSSEASLQPANYKAASSKREESQISSSSSSKHISAGLTSPKDDEDDFWNM